MKGSTAYDLDRPDKLLRQTTSYCANTQILIESRVWTDKGRAKMQEMMRRGFEGKRNSIARVLRLYELPQEPRLALWGLERCFWLNGEGHWKRTEFKQPATSFYWSESQARQSLLSQWHKSESRARFSWEWSRLDDKQKKHRLGFTGDELELERVMSLVLAARNHDWKEGDCLIWQFDADNETGQFAGSFVNANQHNQQEASLDLLSWDDLLIARYASSWRSELVVQHECVKPYLSSLYYEFGYAIRNQAPTAHEQLEAKLALRDWLADKATPEQARELLASLET